MHFLLATFHPLYAASGLVVGLLVGFTGVGGGSLMTPLLVLLFGIHPATAVGTDLLYAGITKISGSLVPASTDAIDWRLKRRHSRGSAADLSAPAPGGCRSVPGQAHRQGKRVADNNAGGRARRARFDLFGR